MSEVPDQRSSMPATTSVPSGSVIVRRWFWSTVMPRSLSAALSASISAERTYARPKMVW